MGVVVIDMGGLGKRYQQIDIQKIRHLSLVFLYFLQREGRGVFPHVENGKTIFFIPAGRLQSLAGQIGNHLPHGDGPNLGKVFGRQQKVIINGKRGSHAFNCRYIVWGRQDAGASRCCFSWFDVFCLFILLQKVPKSFHGIFTHAQLPSHLGERDVFPGLKSQKLEKPDQFTEMPHPFQFQNVFYP